MKLWVRSPLPHMLTCTKTSWKNSGLAWIMVNAIRSLDWRGVDEDTRINEPVDMGRNSLKEIKARSWESVRSQFKLDLRQCALYVIFFFLLDSYLSFCTYSTVFQIACWMWDLMSNSGCPKLHSFFSIHSTWVIQLANIGSVLGPVSALVLFPSPHHWSRLSFVSYLCLWLGL